MFYNMLKTFSLAYPFVLYVLVLLSLLRWSPYWWEQMGLILVVDLMGAATLFSWTRFSWLL